MCEKADESGWSRVLSNAKQSGEENRRAFAGAIIPTVSPATESRLGGGADNPKPMQAGEFADHAQEKSQEAAPETIKAADDAVYKDATGKAENVMQDVDKTINHVTVPAIGQQMATTSVAAQPMMTAAPSRQNGSSVVDTVMQNPLPAALMGLGLSWLLMNMYQSRKGSVDYKAGRIDHRPDGQIAPTQIASSQGQPAMLRTQSAAGEMPEHTQGNGSSVASQIKDEVSDLADRTREQMSNLTNRVQQGVRRVRHQYQQSLQENPLAVGAAALALGSAIGLALPSTPVEDKLMGKAHDNLMQKVDEATHGTVQKVREVAGEAGRAARREAEYQGLTG